MRGPTHLPHRKGLCGPTPGAQIRRSRAFPAARMVAAAFALSVSIAAQQSAAANVYPAVDDFAQFSIAPNVVRALRGNEPGFINNPPTAYTLSEGSLPGKKTRVVYD